MFEMQCPLCFGRTLIHEICCSDAVYYHCNSCDLIFKDRQHWLSPEQEKERYLQHENTLENKGYVQMFERFIACAVSPYLEPGSQLLDFGCGPGPVLQILLQRSDYQVDVYDPFFAPKKVFAGKQYDGIVSTEVFEHLYQPGQEIHMLCRHLKPAGFLSVMTQLRPSNTDFCEWWYRRDNTHVAFYSIKTMKWIAQSQQLRLAYCDGKRVTVFQKL